MVSYQTFMPLGHVCTFHNDTFVPYRSNVANWFNSLIASPALFALKSHVAAARNGDLPRESLFSPPPRLGEIILRQSDLFSRAG